MMPRRLATSATFPRASGVAGADPAVNAPVPEGCDVAGRCSGAFAGRAGVLGACGAAVRVRGLTLGGSAVGLVPAGRWRAGGASIVTDGRFGAVVPGGVVAGAGVAVGAGVAGAGVTGAGVAGTGAALGGGVS
jgi:hypothetical protein